MDEFIRGAADDDVEPGLGDAGEFGLGSREGLAPVAERAQAVPGEVAVVQRDLVVELRIDRVHHLGGQNAGHSEYRRRHVRRLLHAAAQLARRIGRAERRAGSAGLHAYLGGGDELLGAGKHRTVQRHLRLRRQGIGRRPRRHVPLDGGQCHQPERQAELANPRMRAVRGDHHLRGDRPGQNGNALVPERHQEGRRPVVVETSRGSPLSSPMAASPVRLWAIRVCSALRHLNSAWSESRAGHRPSVE